MLIAKVFCITFKAKDTSTSCSSQSSQHIFCFEINAPQLTNHESYFMFIILLEYPTLFQQLRLKITLFVNKNSRITFCSHTIKSVC
ncbi:hypothetical protein Hanom_Chr01g00079031 [Helianthus anomalus]